MKLIRQILLCIFAIGLNSALVFHAQAKDDVPVNNNINKNEVNNNPYNVAVLPFATNSRLNMDELGQEFPLLLNAYMSASENLALVERGEIKKALDEMSMGISGTVDPNSAARIGYLTGARVLVTGRIFPVQKDLFVVAKIVGTETGRVYGETVKIPLKGDIDEAAMSLASKVIKNIEDKGDTLVVQPEAEEDQLTSLKQLIKDKTLPTISIDIKEQSLGRALDNPAAQSEITSLLHQLGFTVIDTAESNVRADVEINGEAFSEFGMRNGSLVSSNGRLDLKAVNVKTGKIIHASNKVAVAVDLSREIAGKKAISIAATQLSKALMQDIVK